VIVSRLSGQSCREELLNLDLAIPALISGPATERTARLRSMKENHFEAVNAVKPLKMRLKEAATADELSLLQWSRLERAPVEARVRTLRALGIAMSATTGATTSAPAAQH
jgi:hypothetical protein